MLTVGVVAVWAGTVRRSIRLRRLRDRAVAASRRSPTIPARTVPLRIVVRAKTLPATGSTVPVAAPTPGLPAPARTAVEPTPGPPVGRRPSQAEAAAPPPRTTRQEYARTGESGPLTVTPGCSRVRHRGDTQQGHHHHVSGPALAASPPEGRRC